MNQGFLSLCFYVEDFSLIYKVLEFPSLIHTKCGV